MNRNLAFLGPIGSYTEQAALTYDSEATLVPLTSIPAVASAVDSKKASEGIVPIENSLEGTVTTTLDLLIHETNLFIRHELVLPIQHCLLTKPGTKPEDLAVIYSHPQALAQCRMFLEKRFPNVGIAASLSTSSSVEDMLGSNTQAGAIANHRCATLYGAEILDKGIEDSNSNLTRFIILAPTDHQPTGEDKTSICFDFDNDSPGILHSVLKEFAKRNINLAKIESRPTRQNLGRYIFVVDLEGHRDNDNVKEALNAVRAQVSMFRIFGSYPMHVSSSI